MSIVEEIPNKHPLDDVAVRNSPACSHIRLDA
jgi:hypothetical protein